MLKKMKKMSKKERKEYGWVQMYYGTIIVLFVAVWTYFNSIQMALLVLGVLLFLKGFFMAMKKK